MGLKMKYDKELEGLARLHASTCLYGHIKHAGTTKYKMHGENIYFSINRLTGKENIERAIMLWGEEYKDYNYYTRKCEPGKKCGHYTQIVWHSSYAVGCAINLCPLLRRERSTSTYKNAKYVVCNYGPAGNWIGRFPYTKGASMSQCPAGQVCVGKGATVTTTTPAATNQSTAATEHAIDVEHKITKDLQVKKDLAKKIKDKEVKKTKDLKKKEVVKKTKDLVGKLKDLPKKTDKKEVLEEDKKLLKKIKWTVTKLERLLKKIDFEDI